MNAFNQKQLRSFIYLNRVGNNKTRDGYNEAVKKVIFLHNVKDPIILEGIYEAYENRNGNKLMWILITFLGGAVTWLMIVLFRPFKDGQPTAYLQKL